MSEEQMERLGVETAIAWAGTINTTIEVPGRIALDPAAVAHVVPRVSGVVREVTRRIGDSIKAGDTLAVLESAQLAEAKAHYLSRLQQKSLADLDLERAQTIAANTRKMLEIFQGSPNMEAVRSLAPLDLGVNRGTLVSAYSEMVMAESRFQREQALKKRSLTSEAEFQTAESDSQKASAVFLSTREDLAFSNRRMLEERQRAQALTVIELKVAERKLFAMGLTKEDIPRGEAEAEAEQTLSLHVVTSPQDGVLLEQHLVRGELFDGGTQPFTIADLRTVWVVLTVYPKDLQKVRAGLEVEVVLNDGSYKAEGKLDWVSPVVDETSHTATARVVVSNADGRLMPGLFVTGRVRIQKEAVPILVPREAIQTVEEKTVAFVRSDSGFELHSVTTGRADSTHVEVLTGLTAGDVVASRGAFTIKAELGKGEAAHEH